mgnify:CR=1 FL=1
MQDPELNQARGSMFKVHKQKALKAPTRESRSAPNFTYKMKVRTLF